MVRGSGEDPRRSPAAHLAQVDYPATREDLVQTAEDNEAPVEVINFFKCLPKEKYGSQEEVLRDFAEAERVFGAGTSQGGKRPNINQVDEDPTRHPQIYLLRAHRGSAQSRRTFS